MQDGRYLLPWVHLYEKILLVVLGMGSMASSVWASLLNVDFYKEWLFLFVCKCLCECVPCA